VSENGTWWRGSQQGSHPAGAWQPVQPGQPLPPGYEPVHHEPGLVDQRRPADSPWRRTERQSRPEARDWQQGTPISARYGDEGRHGPYDDDPGYGGGGGFVPGFGDDTDLPGHGDPGDSRGRGGRRTRGDRGGRGNRGDRGGRPKAGGPRGPGRSRRRRFRWLAPLAAVLVILIPLLVAGAYGYSFIKSKYYPPDYSGAGTSYLVVQVPSGATPTSLGPELQKLGVVASARAFVLAAEHSSAPGGLLPGFYGMRRDMKASLAYALLLNPKNLVQVTVTIPEGLRLTDIVATLAKKTGIAIGKYDAVLKDPAQLHLPSYAKGHPEGYLFPATYEVQPHETALGVLTAMVQAFDQEAASVNLTQAARQVHLTPDQVIIMASLVQAEGGRITDYPKIARVIYNRLAQNIPLQLDSTVFYALHTYGIVASDKDLNSTSPYNTYKYKGLTPGPIDSPGDAAIKAVLHPASGNWVYFVTVNPKTGLTLFTASEAQFQIYRQELEKNLGQG
jgi:peptidoglycan lytic transglycosylase G